MAGSSAAKNLAMALATGTYRGLNSIGRSIRKVGNYQKKSQQKAQDKMDELGSSGFRY